MFKHYFWPTLGSNLWCDHLWTEIQVPEIKGTSEFVKYEEDGDNIIYNISIPDIVLADNVSATIKDGVLIVKLPKTPPKNEDGSRKVNVGRS
jgi:HSP20 family molecular chaperone IbpA